MVRNYEPDKTSRGSTACNWQVASILGFSNTCMFILTSYEALRHAAFFHATYVWYNVSVSSKGYYPPRGNLGTNFQNLSSPATQASFFVKCPAPEFLDTLYFNKFYTFPPLLRSQLLCYPMNIRRVTMLRSKTGVGQRLYRAFSSLNKEKITQDQGQI